MSPEWFFFLQIGLFVYLFVTVIQKLYIAANTNLIFRLDANRKRRNIVLFNNRKPKVFSKTKNLNLISINLNKSK